MKYVLCLLAPALALASSPASWEMSSFAEFIRGRFENVALSRAGELSVARRFEPIFSSTEPFLWSVAETPASEIYVGTGNRGQLYRIGVDGKSSLIWTAPEPEIFAIVSDARGFIYAGTSPNGKVYRIENGNATVFFDPHSQYIWSLAIGADRALYVATGNQGNIYRVTAADTGEIYYSTGQANVTGLTFDREGRLLAGTEPNGILYRITAKDKAFVLYDANLPEIRAIATDVDGSVYAVALGGSVAHKTQNAAPGGVGTNSSGLPTVTTSVTVTAEGAQAGGDIKPPAPPEAPKPQPAPATQSQTASAVVDVTGVEKSAIYKIHPDHTVETLWSSKEENVYDLLALKNEILFGTDLNGRIYRFGPDRKLSLLEQTNDAEITRLFRVENSVLAATGNSGKIYRLSDSSAATGIYESPVYDAGSVARWGHLASIGTGPLKFFTRTGNAVRPDRTWSDWEDAETKIASPNARYIQWKAELSLETKIEGVSIAYLPQNNPPAVHSITVLSNSQQAPAASKQSAQTGAAYSITVTDTGDAGPSTSTGTQVQTITRAASQNLIVSWQADDPDGDKLVYSLYFRGEGERDWKPLKLNLHENTFTIDGDALADGRYSFRVTASDREVNAPGLDAELESSPVLIDNTPPAIVTSPMRGNALDFFVTDNASPLRRCEYSIDAGPWIPVSPVEGFLDSRSARFHLDLTNRPPGEHVLVLRAFDSGNNAGLAKIILR